MGQANYSLLIGATVLVALLPTLLGLFTALLKVTVTLSILRQGIGAQTLPGGVLSMGLAVAITAFIMSPTIERSWEAGRSLNTAVLTNKVPTLDELERFKPIFIPWQDFLLEHVGEREVVGLLGKPGTAAELPFPKLVLAFVLSELREAFSIGFVLLLPFLVVDIIVSNVLVGMGLSMMSPTLVALPLKLLLFVAADGWLLLTRGLIRSYGVGL